MFVKLLALESPQKVKTKFNSHILIFLLVTSHAGGLTALTKMPSCNIMLLGAQKKTLQGFSRLQMLPHTGYIYYAKIVQDLPPEFRRKAAKLVSAKMTLAARSDCFHQSDDGVHGKASICSKTDHWCDSHIFI